MVPKALVHGTLKKFHIVSEDPISSMPDDVVIDIMDRLPIEDAVRTGILSRNWRFKWHMLTQLRLEIGKHSCCSGRNISIVLLNLKGPITKFDLCVKHYTISDVEDISSWVLFLSRKGIKKLTIFNFYQTLQLPTHLFSCLELKHLSLYKCCFHLPTSFRGFPNLLTLQLSHVVFKRGNYGKIISRCPLLESLTILTSVQTLDELIKPTEIANLKSLKVLSLPLRMFDDMTTITTVCVLQLMGFFSQLQELHLDFRTCKFLADAIEIDPITFTCLKFVNLNGVDYSNGIMVSCAVELICSSPNLKTLRITGTYSNQKPPPPVICSSDVDDYSRMLQSKLETVWLGSMRGLEYEVRLIKFILDCSPMLKKMTICTYSSQVFDTKLFQLQRASPIAEIDLILL